NTPGELKKVQEKIGKLTEAVLKLKSKAGIDGIGDKNTEAEVRKQLEEARRRMAEAEGKLGKSNREGAGDDMGRAVGHFDNALRKLDELLRQLRKEEMLAILADLKQRCERMLALQTEVRDGTVKIDAEVQKTSDKLPTLAHRSRANALGDKEG